MRMGTDKGLQLVNGKALVAYIIETLQKIGSEIKIIAHHQGYTKFNKPIIEDIIKEKGPLGGIFTALAHAKQDILILSADTPFITETHIRQLKEKHRQGKITVAIAEDKIYPLFAIYPYRLLNSIKTNINMENLKLMRFLENNRLNKVEIRLSPLEKLNINTKEDLVIAEKLLQHGN